MQATPPLANPLNVSSANAVSEVGTLGWRGSAADSPTIITPDLAAYIAERDSAYLATTSAAGQPYVQHRGGRARYIKVLDPKTLTFADFVGNRQYTTVGNLAENDRAFLFFYELRKIRAIKIWGGADVVLDDTQLFEHLSDRD